MIGEEIKYRPLPSMYKNWTQHQQQQRINIFEQQFEQVAFQMLSHLTLIVILQSKDYLPNCKDEKLKAWRCTVTCPRNLAGKC